MESKQHDETGKGEEQVRVDYHLPVALTGEDATGAAFSEHALAENVTRRGAFIATERTLAPGASLALYDADNASEWLCDVEVVWIRSAPDGAPGAGVKLLGENDRWMAYLVTHSIQTLEDDTSSVE